MSKKIIAKTIVFAILLVSLLCAVIYLISTGFALLQSILDLRGFLTGNNTYLGVALANAIAFVVSLVIAIICYLLGREINLFKEGSIWPNLNDD